MFLRWKNAVLQMLETWLSNERLLSNSTPRFLTDEEELTKQPRGAATDSGPPGQHFHSGPRGRGGGI